MIDLKLHQQKVKEAAQLKGHNIRLVKENKELKADLTTAESAVADLMELNDKFSEEVDAMDNRLLLIEAEVKSLNKVVDAAVKVEKWHTGEIKSPYTSLRDAVYQELFDAVRALNQGGIVCSQDHLSKA